MLLKVLTETFHLVSKLLKYIPRIQKIEKWYPNIFDVFVYKIGLDKYVELVVSDLNGY